ncbi:MAG: hypothetical protein L6437_07940 [Kiritimatiellae bacterium]|nr:hypothetical protein [Kiritimatiellia bacterium]
MSLSPEQRQELVRLLEKGKELSPEWARILFPPEKREYELVYHGKEESIYKQGGCFFIFENKKIFYEA